MYLGQSVHIFDPLTNRCYAAVINDITSATIALTVFPTHGPILEASRRIYGMDRKFIHPSDEHTDNSNWYAHEANQT